MSSFLELYDWQLTSQILLVCCISIFLIFYKKLKSRFEEIISIPFSLCLAISIFNSDNLISLIFFSEVILNLSNILFKNKYKQYNYKHFENVRYFFWLILIFCYHLAFKTFNFNNVPHGGNIELIFICTLLISISFIQILNFILRRDNGCVTFKEVVGHEILIIFVFCMKCLYLVSTLTDFLEPKYHTILDTMVMFYIIIGSLLTLRFVKSDSTYKLTSIMRSLVVLTLFPVLAFGDNRFWSNFSEYLVTLVLLLVILELTVKTLSTARPKALAVFILFCLITGLHPYGHFSGLFKGNVDDDSQIFLLIGLCICLVPLSLTLKQVLKLSMNKKVA